MTRSNHTLSNYQMRVLNLKSTRIKGHVRVWLAKNLLWDRTLGVLLRRDLRIPVAHAKVANQELTVAHGTRRAPSSRTTSQK